MFLLFKAACWCLKVILWSFKVEEQDIITIIVIIVAVKVIMDMECG